MSKLQNDLMTASVPSEGFESGFCIVYSQVAFTTPI